MSELRFEDILINAGIDEFGRMTGYVEFPYFHKQIEVICHKDVTAEYAARSIRWLVLPRWQGILYTLIFNFFQKNFQFPQDTVLPLVNRIRVYPHVQRHFPYSLVLEKQTVYQFPLIIRQ